MTEICRTCLHEISESSVVFYLDAVDSQSETITIRCKLTDCIPEMDLDVVPNAFICNSCFESLMIAHEFKNKCLETEGRIQSYIEQMGYVLTSVNLREIIRQANNNSTTMTNSKSSFVLPNNSKPHSTNQNSIVKDEEPKANLKNLQCDTRAFFAVPKIAQLLAENNMTHKCTKCNYKVSSDAELKLHEQTAHANPLPKGDFAISKIAQLLAEGNGTTFKCNRCSYTASNDFDLKSHQDTHLMNQDYFMGSKIAHLLGQENGATYKCSLCTYTASSDLDLQSHEELHMNQKLHKCMQCDYTAPKRQTLIVHMRKHNGEKPYKCKECGYSTPYRNTLVQHLKLHPREKPYKCDFCDFSSIYSSTLKKHTALHFDEDSFNFKMHVSIGDDKAYKCILCDYSSSHKTNLKYHLKMRHSNGEKPFHCENSSQNNLKSHTGEKKILTCGQCNYTTTHIKSLKHHKQMHVREKPFFCSFCNYSCSTKINLVKHIMIHTGEKLVICSLCQKTFCDVESLKRHMKHHNDVLNSLDTTDVSELTSDASNADFQIKTDTNNCKSAVKKEMII